MSTATGSDSPVDKSCPPPVVAENEADEASTPVKAKRAVDDDMMTTALGKRKVSEAINISTEGVESDVDDDADDGQSNVDGALAAFIAAHNLDVKIFQSAEWQQLLSTANRQPLPPLNESYESTPAILLARASAHQYQAALCRARRMSEGLRGQG